MPSVSFSPNERVHRNKPTTHYIAVVWANGHSVSMVFDDRPTIATIVHEYDMEHGHWQDDGAVYLGTIEYVR